MHIKQKIKKGIRITLFSQADNVCLRQSVVLSIFLRYFLTYFYIYCFYVFSSRCVRGRCSYIPVPCTDLSLPFTQYSLTRAKCPSFSGTRQENRLTASVKKNQKNQADLFSCHKLQHPDSFIFLTFHWLLYSSKTIQERKTGTWCINGTENTAKD